MCLFHGSVFIFAKMGELNAKMLFYFKKRIKKGNSIVFDEFFKDCTYKQIILLFLAEKGRLNESCKKVFSAKAP